MPEHLEPGGVPPQGVSRGGRGLRVPVSRALLCLHGGEGGVGAGVCVGDGGVLREGRWGWGDSQVGLGFLDGGDCECDFGE